MAATGRRTAGPGPAARLDLAGLLLAGSGLLGIVFGVMRGNDHGWTSVTVLPPMLAGAALHSRGRGHGPDGGPVVADAEENPGRGVEDARLSAASAFPLPRRFRAGWTRLQAELAAAAPRGRHVVIDGTGHNIPGNRPDAVADAILAVAAQARASGGDDVRMAGDRAGLEGGRHRVDVGAGPRRFRQRPPGVHAGLVQCPPCDGGKIQHWREIVKDAEQQLAGRA